MAACHNRQLPLLSEKYFEQIETVPFFLRMKVV
jgi:hypothetical protein